MNNKVIRHYLKSILLMVAGCSLMAACKPAYTIGKNPARMLRSENQAQLLREITPVDSSAGLYVWHYTADYHLDSLLTLDIAQIKDYVLYLGHDDLNLLRGVTHLKSIMPGCSVFYMTDGVDHYTGRNFDYPSTGDGATDAIVVYTAPEHGYKSMGVFPLSLLMHRQHSMTDGKTDLSMLWAAPYLVMDGVNEKGLFVSVLYLDGQPTAQTEQGKHDIMTLSAIRLLLDKSATVDEALSLLNQYNMHGGMKKGSYHYFVADDSGRHCVIEYVADEEGKAWKLSPVDADYVTNFYLNKGHRDTGHGYERYFTLQEHFKEYGNWGNAQEALTLLQCVAQTPKAGKRSSQTQHSSAYNLNDRTLQLCWGRHYDHVYHFSLE